MKKYTIIVSLVFSVFLSSCGLLDEDPQDTFSNKNFYRNEADAISALYYAYTPINDIEYMLRTLYELIDIPTNECYDYGIEIYEHTMYRWENPTEEFFFNFFRHPYLSIQRSNSLLENIHRVQNITTAKRNKIIGEAKFLLGFNYFMLVRSYGSVPLRTKSTVSIDEVTLAKSPIKDIYGFIISNLEASISLMDIERHQGRVDKVAAQALLAKVYITLASSKATGAPGYEWVEDADKMYEKAAQYASDVLTKQKTYALEQDLGKIYDVDYQMTCPEHIMITSCNREGVGPEGSYSQLQAMFGVQINGVYISNSPSTIVGGEADVKPYQDPNMASWMAYRTDPDFYQSFDDKDLRKKLFLTTIYNKNGSARLHWDIDNHNSADPDTRKFFYPPSLKFTDAKSKQHLSSVNTYILRVADIALIYAEAVGPTTDGYKWINSVRKRAKLDDLPSGLDIGQFREAVYQERIKELCFEGHALFDLRRLNRVNSTYITNKTINASMAYFFPIPRREIDLNK